MTRIRLLSVFSMGLLAGTAGSQTLDFTKSSPIALQDFGHIRLGYPACGSDGTIYVNMMIDPLRNHFTRIIAIRPDAAIKSFVVLGDRHFRSPTIASFTPRENGLDVLVSALPSEEYRAELPAGGVSQFLVRFGSDGTLNKVLPLSANYRFLRVTADAHDKLVAFVMEKSSTRPMLVEVGDTGQIGSSIDFNEHFLETGEALSYFQTHNPQVVASEYPVADRVEYALGSLFQLQSDQGTVTLLRANGKPALFRRSASGVVDVVHPDLSELAEVRASFSDTGSSVTLVGFVKGGANASLMHFGADGKFSGLKHTVGLSEASPICPVGNGYVGLGFPGSVPTLYKGSLAKDKTESLSVAPQ